jgi:hypothetical protein
MGWGVGDEARSEKSSMSTYLAPPSESSDGTSSTDLLALALAVAVALLKSEGRRAKSEGVVCSPTSVQRCYEYKHEYMRYSTILWRCGTAGKYSYLSTSTGGGCPVQRSTVEGLTMLLRSMVRYSYVHQSQVFYSTYLLLGT